MAHKEIEIDEALARRVMEQHRLESVDDAVDTALRRMDVSWPNVKPMTREEALAMEGIGWDGDLDEMRGRKSA